VLRTSKHIVNIVFAPSISSLNFEEIKYKSMLQAFLIQTHIRDNTDKNFFSGLKVITCIISLNYSVPIIQEYTFTEENIKPIITSIKKYITEEFTKEYHEKINTFLQSSYVDCEEKYKKMYKSTPEYLKIIFDNARSKMSKRKTFLSDATNYLETALNNFLELPDNFFEFKTWVY